MPTDSEKLGPGEQQVTLQECVQHIRQVPMERRISQVIVHHTWRPTAADYHGLSTVRGVRRYHMQQQGWSDNGYHIMIGPPGDIFLCRPMSRAGAHCRGHNQYSIGLAYIADFDSDNPADYPGVAVGQQVVAALLERFELTPEEIHFHREYANKTCPGTRLHLDEYRYQVELLDSDRTDNIKVVLLPGSQAIPCRPRLEEGTTRVDLRPLATALDCEVYDHLADQGKVYVRRRVQTPSNPETLHH